jgi:pimeloyl-ACP methyl ester carboxylesterase
MALDYTKKFVQNNEIQIYTEAFGDQNNPTVLLIAGAMAPARFWTDTFCTTLMQHGFYVIRYDNRDTGLSSAIDFAKNPYTIQDLAKDAIAILDAYDIKKAHLVGHSLGGMLVQLLALDYPDRCLSITSISGVLLSLSQTEIEKKILEITWPILRANKPTLSYEESVHGFLKSYEYLNGKVFFDRAMAETFIRDMCERSNYMYVTADKQVKAFEMPHNHVKIQENLGITKKDLQKIHVPCLVIHGQEDYLVFPSGSKAAAQEIPGATLKIIPKMGHMFFNHELEKTISDFIIQFLKSL